MESYDTFSTLAKTGLVQGRINALKAAGLQTFELKASVEILNYTGQPPYPHPAS
jgi:hypothetical protein